MQPFVVEEDVWIDHKTGQPIKEEDAVNGAWCINAGECISNEDAERYGLLKPAKAVEVRASAVLDEFLNPLQRADFERCGAFTAVGCDSGHHYMITHRHSPVLRDGGMKTLLRDLTDGGDVCSRDIGLPPSEECLALLLMVTLREDYWLHAESRPWRSLDDLKDAVGVALGVYQERGGLPTVRVEWTEPGGQRTKRTFVVRDGHWETARPKTKGK